MAQSESVFGPEFAGATDPSSLNPIVRIQGIEERRYRSGLASTVSMHQFGSIVLGVNSLFLGVAQEEASQDPTLGDTSGLVGSLVQMPIHWGAMVTAISAMTFVSVTNRASYANRLPREYDAAKEQLEGAIAFLPETPRGTMYRRGLRRVKWGLASLVAGYVGYRVGETLPLHDNAELGIGMTALTGATVGTSYLRARQYAKKTGRR